MRTDSTRTSVETDRSTPKTRFMVAVLCMLLPWLVHSQPTLTSDVRDSRTIVRSNAPRAVTNAQAVIARGRELLDALAYDSTRALVTEYLSIGRMPISERRELLQLAAASSYSEDGRAADREAARGWLEQLVRMDPDATVMREYAWSGLDDLLAEVRSSIFGATARFQARYELVGTRVAGRVDVVATRPARFVLYVNRRGFGDRFVMDSTALVRSGSLRLLAHDGNRALMSDGLYELQVVAYEDATGDSVVVPSIAAQAQGAEPFLMDLPPTLAERNLLPEVRAPARVEGLAFGLVAGVATAAIARYARGPSPFRNRSAADGRAIGIGFVVGLGGTVAGVFDRGGPINENIAANAFVREQYEREARFAMRYNETWIANFRVVIIIDTEADR